MLFMWQKASLTSPQFSVLERGECDLFLCLFRYIDEGHNPELFTSHQLEQSLADYRAVQKKVQAYKVDLFSAK